MKTHVASTALALAVAMTACAGDGDGGPGAAARNASQSVCGPVPDALTLPDGFCATVFHEGVGPARHVTVSPGGDVWVALSGPGEDGSTIVGLRDADGDGTADEEQRFGSVGGSGVLLRDGWLYFAANDHVMRYPMAAGALTPSGDPETLVEGLPTGGHGAKSLAFAPDGRLLVNIGSRSNACQQETRTAGSPGQDPCPELPERAGVWAFAGDVAGQTQGDGARFATGLRNAFALAAHPTTGQVYAVVHGRDQLHTLWPELFTEEQSAEKPAEEFVAIDEGDDFGWPYCYYDPDGQRKVLAPEYGGDGIRKGRCERARDPLIGFPAHWAPNDLTFVTEGPFPRKGAFIAFHGSWNRAPLPQGGYNVVFAPFEGDEPTREWEVFMDGFAGSDVSPQGARYRPNGVAATPDGGLLVVDGQEGRIWKVVYATAGSASTP